jgi:DNA-binding LacI/PurR family transcriptional regulator
MLQSALTPHRPSLIEHTATAVRDGLRQGAWEGHLPSERELSLLLKVSRPTLRSALAILAKEGWFTTEPGRLRSIVASASMPQRTDTKVVALLSPVPLSELVPFAPSWTEGLREFLAKDGYELRTDLGGRWWHSANPERELEALTERKPAAVWVLFRGSERIQRWFGQSSKVCVTSGSEHTGVQLPSVDLNHRATCRHAAGQFLSLGHKRVVLLRQGPSSAGDIESEEGFLEAFRGHPDTYPVVAEHDGTPAGLQKKLDSVFRGPQRPTGCLITHAKPAMYVSSELTRRGLSVPRDVSVICRASDSFLDYFVPGIARYRVDPVVHAQRLGRLVLQYANGGAPRVQRVRLMPNFYAGDSLAPPPALEIRPSV